MTMDPNTPVGTSFLESLGLQRRDPNVEGPTSRPFFQRDNFANLLGSLATSLNSMRLNPDPTLAQRQSQLRQRREQNQVRNRTVQALINDGREDLARQVQSGALSAQQAVTRAYNEKRQDFLRKQRLADEAAARTAAANKPTAAEQRAALADQYGLTGENRTNYILTGGLQPTEESEFQKRTNVADKLGLTGENRTTFIATGGLKPTEESEFQTRTNVADKLGLTGENRTTFIALGEFPKTPESAKPNLVNFRNTETGDVKAFDVSTEEGARNAMNFGVRDTTQIIQNINESPTDMSAINELIQTAKDAVEPNLDISLSAGGDFGGVATDFLNLVVGFTTGLTFDERRQQQVANLNRINNRIKIPLVRILAPRGAKYASDQIDKLLPQPNDNNVTFTSKLKALLPDIEATLKGLAVEIDALERDGRKGAAISQREDFNSLIQFQTSAEAALRKNETANTNLQSQADAIVDD